MKAASTGDLAVNVRRQAWEEPPAIARFFDGIYLVTLEDAVELRVFPEVDRSDWPPPEPSDVEDVQDAMTARRNLLAMTDYAVLADDALAGADRALAQFPLEDGWPRTGRCFFVDGAEHEALCRQLDRLTETAGGVHRTVPASSLGDTPLAWLLMRVVTSPHLADEDRQALGL